MNPFDSLQGNEKQKKYFAGEIAKGKLPHAFILEGEEGSGRHTLALAVAAALAGEKEAAEKIMRGQCPDVTVYGLAPDKKIFTVETVRRMKSDAAIKPNDLPFRLIILANGECMNQQAQNAALKILEEPPENTYFFILTESAAALLPTVRSRAPVIRMQRFSFEELEALLLKKGENRAVKQSDPAFFTYCLQASGGSYGKAEQLLAGKDKGVFKEKAEALLLTLDPPNRGELLALWARLPANRPDFDKVLSYVQLALRDMLLARSGGSETGLFFYQSREKAASALGGMTSAQLLALYDLLAESRRQLAYNVNLQNARMALAGGIYKIVI